MSMIAEQVVDWCERMTAKEGGTVVAVGGERYDWGQALARECYGSDSHNWPAAPTVDDLARALSWEAGNCPRWVLATHGRP